MGLLYNKEKSYEKRNYNHWTEEKSTYPDDYPRLNVGLRNSLLVRRILRQGKQPHQVYLQRGLAQGR